MGESTSLLFLNTELQVMASQRTELSVECARIETWTDYAVENKIGASIYRHFSNLAGSPVSRMHKTQDCVHHQLGCSVYAFVHTLIRIFVSGDYAFKMKRIARTLMDNP